MMKLLPTGFMDRFLGRGSAALTVPPLDGALKPNNLLEELPKGIAATAPDDIVLWNGAPLWSDAGKLVSQGGVLVEMSSDITALAVCGSNLAVATLQDGLLLLDSALQPITPEWSAPIQNITALATASDNDLWYCTGSETCTPNEWRRDLMEMNRTGHVGRIDLTTGEVRVLKRQLGYPAGIVVLPNGHVVFSETWASHLVEMSPEGKVLGQVFDEIPGYPGRITRRIGGGYWLCIFAPRSPLVEFVLREPAYRKAMLKEVAPEFWVAPNYRSGASFSEPMQGGALKQMGVLKPWAPTWSYGLVVALDAEFIPTSSFHSRTGGRRHGITSSMEHDGKLWLTGRGSGEILNIQLQTEGSKS